MFAIFRKKLFIFGLVLMGGLYAVKWERDKAAAVHIQQISNLLDDRMHPGNNDFAGRRARLCQILATLKEAGDEGLDELMICRKAAEEINMDESYIDVLAESLAQNTRTAMNLGILDAEGRRTLAAGLLPEISKGPYVGGDVDVEYVVPVEHAPELEAYFANMTLRPVLLTQELGSPVDRSTYEKAGHFYQASMISHGSYVRVGSEFEEHMRR
jgi:hypothetical protein